MVGVLILTHGGLAAELLAAARSISGDLEGFKALTLDWGDGQEEGRLQVEMALQELQAEYDGVLILTDIFGGTPSNIAMSFREEGRVEVLAGVNLPMLVRLGCVHTDREGEPGVLARWLEAKTRCSIVSGAAVASQGPPEKDCGSEAGDQASNGVSAAPVVSAPGRAQESAQAPLTHLGRTGTR